MICLVVKVLLVALVAAADVREDYNYDYEDDGLGEYDEDYTPTDVLPTFLATPQEFNVEVGGDITFPCDVQDQEVAIGHSSPASGCGRPVVSLVAMVLLAMVVHFS